MMWWEAIKQFVGGVFGVVVGWMGGYQTKENAKAREIDHEKEELDEFTRLVAEAKAGNREAQREVRRRMSRGGSL